MSAQNIVLGGFGSSGSVQLIVLSGFGALAGGVAGRRRNWKRLIAVLFDEEG